MSVWAEVRDSARKPLVAVASVIALGFLVWGPEGHTLLPESWFPTDARAAWMIRFAVGAFVMVVLPALTIRFWIRPDQDEERTLAAWGFGAGNWKLGLPAAVVLAIVGGLAMFFLGSKQAGLQSEYPLFAPGPASDPISVGDFALYEAVYFLFFLCGEAAMRGMLLFGLERRVGGAAAVVLTTIVQVVWHLGKPLAELATVPVWGLLVGAANLKLRSFWWLLLFHWATNVILDVAIYYHG